MSKYHDGGALCRSEFADSISATAGGSGDATEANGNYVDRTSGGVHGPAQSAKLIITYSATLAEDATLTIAANIQDATDSSGTGVADYGSALAATTVATGDTGGSTEEGTIELDFDLAGANKFLRSQITPNLSAANTDTASIKATWVFFGSDRNPISKTLVSDAR